MKNMWFRDSEKVLIRVIESRINDYGGFEKNKVAKTLVIFLLVLLGDMSTA